MVTDLTWFPGSGQWQASRSGGDEGVPVEKGAKVALGKESVFWTALRRCTALAAFIEMRQMSYRWGRTCKTLNNLAG